MLQQGMPGAMAGFDAIVPFKGQLRQILKPPLFQGSAVPWRRARALLTFKRAADECDFLVADARQMRDGIDRTLSVIGLDQIGFQTRTGSHQ